MRRRNEEVKQLKEEQELLEQKVLMLTGRSNASISHVSTMTPFCASQSPPDLLPIDLDACQNCDSVLASLEAEQRESARLQKENKALVNGIFQLQTEVRLLRRLSFSPPRFCLHLVSCSTPR